MNIPTLNEYLSAHPMHQVKPKVIDQKTKDEVIRQLNFKSYKQVAESLELTYATVCAIANRIKKGGM